MWHQEGDRQHFTFVPSTFGHTCPVGEGIFSSLFENLCLLNQGCLGGGFPMKTCFSMMKSVQISKVSQWQRPASRNLCVSCKGDISQEKDMVASLQEIIHRERRLPNAVHVIMFNSLSQGLQAFLKSWIKFKMWSQALQECRFEFCQPQPRQSRGTLPVASRKTSCGTNTALY